MNVTADVNRSSRSIRGPSFWDHRSEIWFKRSGSTLRKPRWRASEVSTGHPRSRIHGVSQRGVLRTKGDRDGWPRRKRPRIMSSAKLHEIFEWKPIRDKITVWRNVSTFRESTPRKKNSTKVPFVSFFPLVSPSLRYFMVILSTFAGTHISYVSSNPYLHRTSRLFRLRAAITADRLRIFMN